MLSGIAGQWSQIAIMSTNAPPLRKRRGSVTPGPTGTSMAALPLWMQRTQILVSLKEQALTSNQMWAMLQTTLPAELASAVQPGKWVDGVWALTASSPAVAAKLKLYGPLLLRQLQKAGWPLVRIAVRVKEPGRDLGSTTPAPRIATGSPAPADVRARLRELRRRHAKAGG